MSEQKFLKLDGNKKAEAKREDFPFGLWHDWTENLNQVSTTSGGFQNILTFTTEDLPTGRYKIDFFFLWNTSNSNGRMEVEIRINGASFLDLELSSQRQGRFPASGFIIENLSGINTIELFYRKSRGGGNVRVFDRKFAIQRFD